MELKVIARIHTDFTTKFGIPRQSGLVSELMGEIVFEPEYRQKEALMGIEEYSHLWLLWEFSEAKREHWSATVCPPRLGGKVRKGVFATRSPFRPNSIGLSCARLERVEEDENKGLKLIVSGADLMDGSPIFDIKPYLPYCDAHPEALGSFGQEHKDERITVEFPKELLERLPKEKQNAALEVLRQDPRAAYQKQPDYVYGMDFAGYDIRFRVRENVLRVVDVVKTNDLGFRRVK